MSESNPIRVFVVHTFSEHPDYVRVFEYLESRPNFYYHNCSNPAASPASGDSEAIKSELRRQIELAEIVILPVTLFTTNPVLVTFQGRRGEGSQEAGPRDKVLRRDYCHQEDAAGQGG